MPVLPSRRPSLSERLIVEAGESLRGWKRNVRSEPVSTDVAMGTEACYR
ncbi:Hypothetical Protein RSKD131_3045 [Cereibacter sphaeroides KD131]|nr:Hypothetical Protein RSKD131_3045 [Cereibacter sphaeroides KD131]